MCASGRWLACTYQTTTQPLPRLSAFAAMPKRAQTAAPQRAKRSRAQGARFSDLPEGILKEHLLPFLCHESWYSGHEFVFEQTIGAGERMRQLGSWKHAGFQWAGTSLSSPAQTGPCGKRYGPGRSYDCAQLPHPLSGRLSPRAL